MSTVEHWVSDLRFLTKTLKCKNKFCSKAQNLGTSFDISSLETVSLICLVCNLMNSKMICDILTWSQCTGI